MKLGPYVALKFNYQDFAWMKRNWNTIVKTISKIDLFWQVYCKITSFWKHTHDHVCQTIEMLRICKLLHIKCIISEMGVGPGKLVKLSPNRIL